MEDVILEIKPEINPKNFDLGVLIMRAQVHKLTPAHIALIDLVCKNHKKVILFLGIPTIGNNPFDRENPLDFATRRIMIQEVYPEIIILPLKDQRSNEKWSQALDREISLPFGRKSALLYGGRDSFIPYYSGKYPTVELITNVFYSGTEIRKEVAQEILGASEFRAGIIHASYALNPIPFPTVDVVPLNDRNQLLLAKKPDEPKYRFIGGFVDARKDKSFELAAKREFREETGGGEIDDLKYIMSSEIDDWRYRGKASSIISTLFLGKFIFGPIKPSDDIDTLRWFNIEELDSINKINDLIMEEHIPSMIKLMEYIKVNNL